MTLFSEHLGLASAHVWRGPPAASASQRRGVGVAGGVLVGLAGLAFGRPGPFFVR